MNKTAKLVVNGKVFVLPILKMEVETYPTEKGIQEEIKVTLESNGYILRDGDRVSFISPKALSGKKGFASQSQTFLRRFEVIV